MSRRSLLERIEAAPPTDVIAVIEDELVAAVGAHGVSFLIADYLGRAVVRFDRWTWSVPDGREPVVEHSETVPLPGTVYGPANVRFWPIMDGLSVWPFGSWVVPGR